MATCCNLDSQRLSPELRASLGSRLARYHTRTGRAEDLGIPVPGETYPMNGTDTRRGIFHGIGLLGGYIAYDLHTRRPLYQGRLPGDIRWSDRVTLIDPKTGCCYGSDPDTRYIVKYDPRTNRFCRTEATIPESPITGREAHPGIRTYARCRLRDGSFIAQTSGGVMFKFFPDEQRTELIGLNWGDGCYCTAMALSRGGRYLYYTVGRHNQVLKPGPPIVQFDTRTRQKKVLAFLHPYYRKKYGYVLGTSYSICLDAKDANLLITWNGHFPGSGNEEEWAGHPAFMCVEIPAGERKSGG